jgi:hypothetical protein
VSEASAEEQTLLARERGERKGRRVLALERSKRKRRRLLASSPALPARSSRAREGNLCARDARKENRSFARTLAGTRGASLTNISEPSAVDAAVLARVMLSMVSVSLMISLVMVLLP